MASQGAGDASSAPLLSSGRPGLPAAPSQGSGGSKERSPWQRLLQVLSARLRYGAILAVGAAMAAGAGLYLGLRSLVNPAALFRTRDRSRMQLPDPLPGLLHETVDVNGVSLEVVRSSDAAAGKPILLLLHGFPEGWFMWRNQMEALRETHDVVAVSLRGYGQSSKPKGVPAYSIENLTNDIVALIERLLAASDGQRTLALGAHDWGGAVAWHVAHLRPDLLSGLIILCSPHPRCFLANMDRSQLSRSWYMFLFNVPWVPEALLRFNDWEALDHMFNRQLRSGARVSGDDLERYKQALSRPGAITAALNFYRAMFRYGASPELRRAVQTKLAVPTLLLWAENDIALGTGLLRGTDKRVETLEVEVLRDCSHWAPLDRAAEVNSAMRQWLLEGRLRR